MRSARTAIFGFAVWLLLAGPALLPGVQLGDRDTSRLYYPVKKFVAEGLRHGELRFWAPWAEGGLSLLGQVTPGLLHPFTLLYALPFELAFTLNHLLALLLGGIGAAWLARRLGASEWGAVVAGVVYGGCGALVSAASSNLPFALGAATVPLALAALMWFCDEPRGGRLLGAACALALCAYAGDPQSFLIAGVLGVSWTRRRAAIWWGLCGALLAAPVALPGMTQLLRSERARGVSAEERAAFSVPPVRLLGLALPHAFDGAEGPDDPYAGLIAQRGSAPFFESLLLGMPALVLAFAAWRRARFPLIAAAVFIAAAVAGLPLGIFRYSEKLMLPASMCVAIAAGLGVDRDWRRLALGAVAASLCAALVSLLLPHSNAVWSRFDASLLRGALESAGLSAALFATGNRKLSPIFAACLCAVTVLLAPPLHVVPLELYQRPSSTAELAKQQGATRIFADASGSLLVPGDLPPFEARLLGAREALWPQLQGIDGLTGLAPYFSAGDAHYGAAIRGAQDAALSVLGCDADIVRGGSPASDSGYSLRRRLAQPRAFVVYRTRMIDDVPAAVAALRTLRLDEEALAPVALQGSGARASVTYERPSASAIDVGVASAKDGLLVVGEHFDPGWSATVDGLPANVVEADLVALGVRVPEGGHRVALRYHPRGLVAGLCAALATALACLALRKQKLA